MPTGFHSEFYLFIVSFDGVVLQEVVTMATMRVTGPRRTRVAEWGLR